MILRVEIPIFEVWSFNPQIGKTSIIKKYYLGPDNYILKTMKIRQKILYWTSSSMSGIVLRFGKFSANQSFLLEIFCWYALTAMNLLNFQKLPHLFKNIRFNSNIVGRFQMVNNIGLESFIVIEADPRDFCSIDEVRSMKNRFSCNSIPIWL